MFDFHMHTKVSFDSETHPMAMCEAAKKAGLKEICFTDHYPANTYPGLASNLFTMEEYSDAYDQLDCPGLLIRRGVEYGMTADNQPQLKQLLACRNFDYVIGSVHYIDENDPYNAEYWQNRSVEECFRLYLQGILDCVKVHDDFDVLGHLTYVCKSVHNPSHAAVPFADFRDITDEIMKILVAKGKGMEINTSGVDRCGCFLPEKIHLQRFRELGGEIITLGSDAHDPSRVGQYAKEALDILKDVFGHVCTFENRTPIFHKL